MGPRVVYHDEERAIIQRPFIWECECAEEKCASTTGKTFGFEVGLPETCSGCPECEDAYLSFEEIHQEAWPQMESAWERGWSRCIYLSPDGTKVLKVAIATIPLEGAFDPAHQCEAERFLWERIEDTKIARYFAPTLESGITEEGHIFSIQVRVFGDHSEGPREKERERKLQAMKSEVIPFIEEFLGFSPNMELNNDIHTGQALWGDDSFVLVDYGTIVSPHIMQEIKEMDRLLVAS